MKTPDVMAKNANTDNRSIIVPVEWDSDNNGPKATEELAELMLSMREAGTLAGSFIKMEPEEGVELVVAVTGWIYQDGEEEGTYKFTVLCGEYSLEWDTTESDEDDGDGDGE